MDLLITNARLIDGTGVPPRTPRSLRIRAGRTAEIERELPAGSWMLKPIFGLRAMLARLKARVDLGLIFRQEATVSP